MGDGDRKFDGNGVGVGDGCSPLSASVPREHEILVLKRGGCAFASKLANIPTFPLGKGRLQLVVVVSSADDELGDQQVVYANNWGNDADGRAGADKKDAARNHPPARGAERKARPLNVIMRPALETEQLTSTGMRRRHPIPLVLVHGGEETLDLLRRAKAVGLKRKYEVRAQGVVVGNLVVL